MSMCHKAFAMDHDAFTAELAPILYRALETGREDELAALVDANRRNLTLPWDAVALPHDWRSVLERGDPHELGDLALTKYYVAAEDHGIKERWLDLPETLPESLRACLLGTAFGPTANSFDPGRMGSYFQNAERAAESRQLLLDRAEPEIKSFVDLLDRVVRAKQGLYVTF